MIIPHMWLSQLQIHKQQEVSSLSPPHLEALAILAFIMAKSSLKSIFKQNSSLFNGEYLIIFSQWKAVFGYVSSIQHLFYKAV